MKTLDVELKIDNYPAALSFLKEALKENGIKEDGPQENILLFEELFVRAAEHIEGENVTANVSVVRSLGEVQIHLRFESKRMVLDTDYNDDMDPGNIILSRYSERINLNYKRGLNTITITAKKNNKKALIMYVSAFVATIFAAVILKGAFSTEQSVRFVETIIYPIESMFGNAMVMLSVPVVFFSLIRNITYVMEIRDPRFPLKRILYMIVLTSVIAILIGMITYRIFEPCLSRYFASDANEGYMETRVSLEGLFTVFYSSIPTNFLDAFTSISPFTLIILGVLTSAAMCLLGKHFEVAKRVFDAITALFCKMLSIVMLFLPLALVLALLEEILMFNTQEIFKAYLWIAILIIVGVILLLLVLAVRIILHGGNVMTFIKQYLPAALMNIRINSSIDAVPYNVRFCSKAFKLPHKQVGVSLNILSEISQSGNCFFMTLITVILMRYWNIQITPVNLVIIGIMVFAFAIGAPGQPGSLMLGVMMVTYYLGIKYEDSLFTMVVLEVLFGWLITFINTTDDIAEIYMSSLKRKCFKR